MNAAVGEMTLIICVPPLEFKNSDCAHTPRHSANVIGIFELLAFLVSSGERFAGTIEAARVKYSFLWADLFFYCEGKTALESIFFSYHTS